MNVDKEAARDAKETARAAMYYGEGAGTRRKLIQATVAQKSKDPAYQQAFRQALVKEDMAAHAVRARRERRTKDASVSVKRNVRGLLTGNKQSMQTSVLVIATLGYVAHQTGLDKKVYDKVKPRYDEWRLNRRVKKAMKGSDDLLGDIINFPKK